MKRSPTKTKFRTPIEYSPKTASLYPGSKCLRTVSLFFLLILLCPSTLFGNDGSGHNLNYLLKSIAFPHPGETPVLFKALSGGYIDLEVLRKYGPGSSFYLALHAREKGQTEVVEDLLHYAAVVEESPLKWYAGLEYLDFLFSQERYSDFFTHYRRMESSEYEGQEFEFLNSRLRGMVLYADLVTKFRLGDRSWEDLLMSFLTNYNVADIPEVFFKGSGQFSVSKLRRAIKEREGFPSAPGELFEGKNFYFKKNYPRAYREYATVLKRVEDGDGSPGMITGSVTDEFALSALYSGYTREAAGIAASLRKALALREGEEEGVTTAIFWLLETEGYLLRKLGRFVEARLLYEEALETAPEEERERIRWYMFDTRFRSSFTEAIKGLGEEAEFWEDHGYYNDVLFNLIDRLVYYNRWADIAKIAKALDGKVSNVAVGRAAYLAARAGENGLLELDAEQIDRWLEAAMYNSSGVGSGLYYRIMAAQRLSERGRSIPFDLFDPSSFCGISWELPAGRKVGATRTWGEGKSSGDFLIEGFVRFELAKDAYRRFGGENEFLASLAPESVRLLAAELQREKAYLESVRLLNRYCGVRKDGYDLGEDDLKLLYPAAYSKFILPLSEEYAFPDFIFYALVREESLFDADISSSAGAVGLSQLMPSTAEDVASRIGLVVEDLNDPALNLRLGAWYLDHLIGRTENYSQALFAYNGGITRVRRWVREYGYLPGDLVLEKIPFAETAHYGRKVLVSSVLYGYFYDNIHYSDIISQFFR